MATLIILALATLAGAFFGLLFGLGSALYTYVYNKLFPHA